MTCPANVALFATPYNVPVKKLATTLLPKFALPALTLPVIARLVNVPTDVMFGCAAV